MPQPSSLIQSLPQAVLSDKIITGRGHRLVYKGITVNATPTEIFIEGIAAYRLAVPSGTTIFFEGRIVAHNDTDGAAAYAARFAGVASQNGATFAAAGTTTEWDAAATDANPYLQAILAIGGAAVAIAYNDTIDAVTITVTGTAAKTLYWTVELYITPASNAGFIASEG